MICSFYAMKNKDIYYLFIYLFILFRGSTVLKAFSMYLGWNPRWEPMNDIVTFPATNSVDTDTRL